MLGGWQTKLENFAIAQARSKKSWASWRSREEVMDAINNVTNGCQEPGRERNWWKGRDGCLEIGSVDSGLRLPHILVVGFWQASFSLVQRQEEGELRSARGRSHAPVSSVTGIKGGWGTRALWQHLG
jgi:hypothetical protein